MNRLGWFCGFAFGLCGFSIYGTMWFQSPGLGFADPIFFMLAALWCYRTGDSFWPRR